MGLFPLYLKIPKLTAWQATPIAFTDGGSVTHFDCVDDDAREAAQEHADATGVDADFFYYLETQQNLKVLSRFEIGEWESASFQDIPDMHDAELESLQAVRDTLAQAAETLRGVEVAGPSWKARLQWHLGNKHIPDLLNELGRMISQVDQEIEAIEDALVAVICNECHERIE